MVPFIHAGTTASGVSVHPVGEHFEFAPAPRWRFWNGRDDTYVVFGIGWKGGWRDGFRVKVPEPEVEGTTYYDLCVSEDIRDRRGDLRRARVGLHPTGQREGDTITIYQAS